MNTKVRELKFRSLASKVKTFQYERVHEVNFRSSSSKVATFQIQSSTRSSSSQALRQHRARGPVGLMSENLRGGPSTFAKLSRILRQTFAKILLESCTQFDPKALHLPQAGFCWLWVAFAAAYSRGNPQAAHFPTNFSPRTSCAHSSFQLSVSKPPLHKTFANNFAIDPLRGTLAEC